MVSVYHGKLQKEELTEMVESLPNTLHVCWSLEKIVFGKGPPEDVLEEGSVFNESCEVKWRKGKDGYEVLVVSDEEASFKGLSPVEGKWDAKNITTRLISLTDRRFTPTLKEYPEVGSEASLECRLIRLNGNPLLISPRKIAKPSGKG
ncbi:MAG: hypothetical protein ACTSUS_09880 [Candidatus Freyarchaeota archaeon]